MVHGRSYSDRSWKGFRAQYTVNALGVQRSRVPGGRSQQRNSVPLVFHMRLFAVDATRAG
ncbi:MAG: hypothetical protein LC808_30445 [Actinobacteria bacterium]|nr:hypothetical protein [Actinomycetota bacterium]